MFGGYDFIMTTTDGETVWKALGMPQPVIAYYLAMPSWMYGPWLLGVVSIRFEHAQASCDAVR